MAAFTFEYPCVVREMYTPVGLRDSLNGGQMGIPLTQRALWDTGANTSAVSADFAAVEGLKPIGMCGVNNAGGCCDVPIYLIDLELPGGIYIPSVMVTEAVLPGFDALIGMDVISRGDFAVTGLNGVSVMSFRIPSSSRVDFAGDASTFRY